MPKIVIPEHKLEFLRAVLRGFLHTHGIEDDPDIDAAEEWLILLGYTRYFRRFTVEIEASNDNGVSDDS